MQGGGNGAPKSERELYPAPEGLPAPKRPRTRRSTDYLPAWDCAMQEPSALPGTGDRMFQKNPRRGKAVECAPGTRDPHLLPADVVTKCRQLNLTLNILVSNDKREKPNCTFLGGCNERAT